MCCWLLKHGYSAPKLLPNICLTWNLFVVYRFLLLIRLLELDQFLIPSFLSWMNVVIQLKRMMIYVCRVPALAKLEWQVCGQQLYWVWHDYTRQTQGHVAACCGLRFAEYASLTLVKVFDSRFHRTAVRHFILLSTGRKYPTYGSLTFPTLDTRHTLVCRHGFCRV